jgi:LPPG:FO 2-phospho-L-lactate transferase
MATRIVALAGGVGGAKLAFGLDRCLGPDLAVVVNTGDDFEHLGLTVCPDLDTVMYTLAGLANPETGWGIAGETWGFLDQLGRYGGPSWFRLGDRDLATHVLRTERLRQGQRLTEVTRELCRKLGIASRVLPMSDAPMRTMVATDEGILAFQQYFVGRRCEPAVKGFTFAGAEGSSPPRKSPRRSTIQRSKASSSAPPTPSSASVRSCRSRGSPAACGNDVRPASPSRRSSAARPSRVPPPR